MATQKGLPLTAIAATAALVAAPMSGLTGSTPFLPLNIVVQVRPSASFKIQNAADLIPSGYTGMTDAAPVLVLNTPPVTPEVIIEVSADAAGPAASKEIGDVGGQDGANGAKLLSLRDLGVTSPAPTRRFEGTNLREVFERAAGEIIYRLDLLKDIKAGRQAPIVVSINL